MLSFPNCKINLGLHITGKREDGFHDLETIFFPIPLTDILEIIPSTSLEFTTSGFAINTDENLCLKAYHLLKKDFPRLPPIKMHLHKAIPMGAGLGGGSADAAFTLQMLIEKFQLQVPQAKLPAYALNLGSDCPFFLINSPSLATGRGEILEDVFIDLSAYKIMIVNPGIHINTGWAFSKVTPRQPLVSIKKIVQQPVDTWKTDLQNDFEVPVFTEYPEIRKLKEELYAAGALYAAMSGSGSSVFGIYLLEHHVEYTPHSSYFHKTLPLAL